MPCNNPKCRSCHGTPEEKAAVSKNLDERAAPIVEALDTYLGLNTTDESEFPIYIVALTTMLGKLAGHAPPEIRDTLIEGVMLNFKRTARYAGVAADARRAGEDAELAIMDTILRDLLTSPNPDRLQVENMRKMMAARRRELALKEPGEATKQEMTDTATQYPHFSIRLH